MKFPCEIISEPYITQLRVEAANFLHKQNYSQSQIAALLQVSQPVVSGYLNKKTIPPDIPEAIILKAKNIGIQVGQILMQDGEEGIPEAIRKSCIECKILRQSGPTCIYHRQIIPQLDTNCDKCLTPRNLIELQVDKESALRRLQTTVRNILKFQNITSLIPEIGMQIVFGVQEIESYSDIVAFPGRINKRKNSAPLYGMPAFGGSETTSHLLMEIRKYNQKLTTIATLKTSKWLVNRMETSNFNLKIHEGFDLDHTKGLDELGRLDGSPIVIVDTGSQGFEAISYLCCSSLLELEESLVKILK